MRGESGAVWTVARRSLWWIGGGRRAFILLESGPVGSRFAVKPILTGFQMEMSHFPTTFTVDGTRMDTRSWECTTLRILRMGSFSGVCAPQMASAFCRAKCRRPRQPRWVASDRARKTPGRRLSISARSPRTTHHTLCFTAVTIKSSGRARCTLPIRRATPASRVAWRTARPPGRVTRRLGSNGPSQSQTR